MIESISYSKLELPMKKPFRISLGSTDSYEGFLVKIKTDDGIVGYGEATSTPFISGDTMGSIENELKIFSTVLKGQEESPELISEWALKHCKSAKASRCAIDTALWDIIGKRANLNVTRLLGNYRKEMPTSYTVDLVDSKNAAKQAKELLGNGISVFKVKMGSGIQADLERIKTVREIVGPDAMVYVDFNQAYSPRKAVEISAHLQKFNVEFMEQPVSMFDTRGLKFVRDHSPIPVFADEAVFGLHEALEILGAEAADGINIKLMKAGGITEAMKIATLAETFGAPVMIGCMVETKLANTAGLAVALSRSIVKYSDLDGYSSIIRDITTQGIQLINGKVTMPDVPGIGFTLT